MNFSSITTLCRTVSRFGHEHNFTFKALPVIVWEFDDPQQFLAARMELERAIIENQKWATPEPVKVTGPFTVEITAAAVTFRLECRHYQFTERGQKGIAELKPGVDFIKMSKPGDPTNWNPTGP